MLAKLEKLDPPEDCPTIANPDVAPLAAENGLVGVCEGCTGAPQGEGLLPNPPAAPNPVPAVPIVEGAPNAGCTGFPSGDADPNAEPIAEGAPKAGAAGFPNGEADPNPEPPAAPIAEGAPKAGAAGFPILVLVEPNPGVPKPGGVGFIKVGVGVPNPVLPIWGVAGVPNVAAGLAKTLVAPFDDGVFGGCPNTEAGCVEADEGGFGEDTAPAVPVDGAELASSLPKTRPGYRVPAWMDRFQTTHHAASSPS